MRCPRCRSSLRVVEYDGIQIEVCSDCRGEWLHAEELEKIIEHHDHIFSARDLAALDTIKHPVVPVEDQDHDVLNCPHCETIEMDRFNYADASDLQLHKCSECGGIWADKDQLEKVEELLDGWKASLAEDTDTFGPVLKKIATEERKELDRDVSISRFGMVNTILRRLLD